MKRAIIICLFALVGMAQGAWADDYVTDVMIAVGTGNRDNYVNNHGWTAINKDLNAGAGGAYVYLLYKKGTDKSKAITDFYIKTGSSPSSLTHNGLTYQPVPGVGGTNLNYDAGGNKIYLFYTKGKFYDDRAVTGLSADNYRAGAVTLNDGASAADLNKGAGGEYIYLHVNYTKPSSYNYVECSWDAGKKKVTKTTKTCSSFMRLTSNLEDTNTKLTTGWYVLDKNVEYNKYLDIDGDVKIILTDRRVLNARNNIRLNTGSKLTVYAQRGYGWIYACGEHGPGIGGYGDIVAGSLEIHGGIIDAKSGSASNAGIGGGHGSGSGYQGVTIYGGTVTAKGFDGGAGIGSGEDNSKVNAGPVTIYGGKVTATGGMDAAGIGGGQEAVNGVVTIYGGTVTATGGWGGAGIGSGEEARLGNNVYIYGGKVTATGSQGGDGIGSGYIVKGANPDCAVVIENAKVTVMTKADPYSGIPRGYAIQANSISVGSSTVELDGYRAMKAKSYSLDNMRVNDEKKDNRVDALETERQYKAKIRTCDHERHGDTPVTYTDNGNGKHTVSCYYCEGLMEDHTYVFYNPEYKYICEKCYAEKPEETTFDVVVAKYNETRSEYEATNYLVISGAEFTLPPCNNLAGNDFAGWAVISHTSLGSSPLLSGDEEELLPAGIKIKVEGQGIELAACYKPHNLTLNNEEPNEPLLSEYMYSTNTISLGDRTLYHDGNWNTLCLPFDIDDFDGTPFAGASVKSISSSAFDNGTLTLNFTDNLTSIEAGRPYIVKWDVIKIGSTEEWNAFASNVNNGTTSYEGQAVCLTANINNISTTVGTESHPFMGTFDGQGYTLNLNITDMTNEGTAPFRYIKDATISHVKTTGQVAGTKHCSGLVGFALSGTNTISNCEVTASISCINYYFGGILGHGKASKSTITDCLFSGTLTNSMFTATGTQPYANAGVIYGWGDDPGEHTIVNCMSNGNYQGNVYLDLLKAGGGTQTVTNCYRNTGDYSQGTQTSATGSDLVFLLGNGWEERDEKVVPKMTGSEVFENVCITTYTPMTVTSECVDFVGTFDPVNIGREGDNTILFLGANNTLYWPNGEMTIGSLRAYFKLKLNNNNGSTDANAVRAFVLNFGDDSEASGISDATCLNNNEQRINNEWYDLSGRRVSVPSVSSASSVLPKGIYIHNGKKIVIK